VKKGNPDIKTMFFDLGKVIVNYNTDLLVEGYNRYGTIDADKYIDYLWNSKDSNSYMEGKITSSQFYTRTKRAFRMKIKYSEFYEVWNSMFWPYPEVESIIRKIKLKYPSIRLILVSNTNEAHFDFIRSKYDILEVFDEFVVSHEVGRQKPHSNIFTRALKAGKNSPKDTFYTDDISQFIKAARLMGIRAFQFTGHNNLKAQLEKLSINI
jgi:putative hydrolase of the HAD superfamily